MYIYLHGFASSPQSTKAKYLRDRFRESGVDLKLVDLNAEDFSSLTLTRQLRQVEALFPPPPTSVTLIGSSFGGLSAAWLGETNLQVERLILLAPAFGFLSHWLPKLGEEQLQQWQNSGYISVYHYGEGRSLPLHYQFILDFKQYPEEKLQRQVPTFILHGVDDEVIPIQSSRDYAFHRPWVKLIELESDHSLTNVMPQIWEAIYDFAEFRSLSF